MIVSSNLVSEVEVALGVQQWSSAFSLEFKDLMNDAVERRSRFKAEQEKAGDSPHFSPITGSLVSANTSLRHTHEDDDRVGSNNQIQGLGPRHITLRYSSPAADLLAEQSFQGLENKVGDKAPAPAVPGQSGIASALYGLNERDGTAR